MARAMSGIMGPISGKIGGVVGSRWKGTPYYRAHVKPGLSRTDLQLAQRARFAYVVAAAKYYVGRVFNPYYDKFLPQVSGFNRFCSNNLPKAPAYTPILAYQVTDGPLYPGGSFLTTYNTSTGAAHATWDTGLGVDGSMEDVALLWFRDRVSNITYFFTNTARGSGAANTHCAGLVAAAI